MKCHNCDFTRCSECGHEELECPLCAAKKREKNEEPTTQTSEIGSSEEGGL